MTRLTCLSLCVLTFIACSKKGDDKPSEQPASQPAAKDAPKQVSVHATLSKDALDALFAVRTTWEQVIAERDADKIAALYADDAMSIPVGSPLSFKGPKEIAEMHAMYGAMFPDLTSETYLMLARDGVVVSMARARGTSAMQPKPSEGNSEPDNADDKAANSITGKKTSFVGLQILDIDKESGKIARETLYADNLSFMGQLGQWQGPYRPYDETAAPAKRQAVSAGSDAEKANVALVRAAVEAFNAHDVAALTGMYAADAVLSDCSEASDSRGPAIGGYFERAFAGFPDLAKSKHHAWAAGAFVVATYHISGTHKGPLERYQLEQGTDKKIGLDAAALYRIDGGKIVEHWVFMDGMFFAITLGAMPMPNLGGAPEADKQK